MHSQRAVPATLLLTLACVTAQAAPGPAGAAHRTSEPGASPSAAPSPAPVAPAPASSAQAASPAAEAAPAPCNPAWTPPFDQPLSVRLAYRGPLPARFHYCPQWSLFGPVRPNGKWHRGVDIAAATGTPVRGAVNGMLKYSRDPNGWGLFARLRFNVAKRAADGSCAPGEDHEILYAHLIDDKPDLVMGVEHEVAAGVIVGRVGCSGNARRMCSPSPESHVHVTLRTVRDRMQIDPLPLAGWTLQTGGADGLAPCLWPTQPPAPAAEAGQT